LQILAQPVRVCPGVVHSTNSQRKPRMLVYDHTLSSEGLERLCLSGYVVAESQALK
jgi:hypothetical protein